MINNVICLDDDTDFLNLLQVHLKKLGLNPIINSDVQLLAQSLAEYEPKLIILDLNIGDNDGMGFNILKSIRNNEKLEKIPILILSRRSSPADIDKALSLGANEYMQKPIDQLSLALKLSGIFELEEHLGINLKIKKVPPYLSNARTEVDLDIIHLSETEIIFKSTFNAPKGTLLKLKSPFLFSVLKDELVTLQIDESSYNQEENNYIIKSKLTHNVYYQEAARSYITSHYNEEDDINNNVSTTTPDGL